MNVTRIPQISHEDLISIREIPEFRPQNKEKNQRSLQMIEPENYRIVHCKFYHDQKGCDRGNDWEFIHVIGYEGK